MRRRTPWDRIVRASRDGHGVRLSLADVDRLVCDGALKTRADLDAACYDCGHDPEECKREECDAL